MPSCLFQYVKYIVIVQIPENNNDMTSKNDFGLTKVFITAYLTRRKDFVSSGESSTISGIDFFPKKKYRNKSFKLTENEIMPWSYG